MHGARGVMAGAETDEADNNRDDTADRSSQRRSPRMPRLTGCSTGLRCPRWTVGGTAPRTSARSATRRGGRRNPTPLEGADEGSLGSTEAAERKRSRAGGSARVESLEVGGGRRGGARPGQTATTPGVPEPEPEEPGLGRQRRRRERRPPGRAPSDTAATSARGDDDEEKAPAMRRVHGSRARALPRHGRGTPRERGLVVRRDGECAEVGAPSTPRDPRRRSAPPRTGATSSSIPRISPARTTTSRTRITTTRTRMRTTTTTTTTTRFFTSRRCPWVQAAQGRRGRYGRTPPPTCRVNRAGGGGERGRRRRRRRRRSFVPTETAIIGAAAKQMARVLRRSRRRSAWTAPRPSRTRPRAFNYLGLAEDTLTAILATHAGRFAHRGGAPPAGHVLPVRVFAWRHDEDVLARRRAVRRRRCR